MSSSDLIELYTRAKVFAATVWLHGLGVNATDLDGVITRMHASRELGLHYIAPSAPLRRITVNGGRPSRAWFDIPGDPAVSGEDREGIEESSARIHRLLDHERQCGIPSEHTVLGGFSQGACIVLHAGLRYPKRLAGIIMLSGELVLPHLLEAERHPANSQTPVLMIHGRDDEVVPPEQARQAHHRLRELGQPVEWHELPVGHAVPPEAVGIVDTFTRRVLEPAAQERQAALG